MGHFYKLATLYILISVIPIYSICQNIDRKLVSTAGGFITGTNGNISYSIGEPVIGLVSGSEVSISQGFQQGEKVLCSIPGFNPFLDKIYSRLDSLELNAGTGYTSYGWSNGTSSQSIHIKYTGGYRVTITNSSGCIGTDSVFVQFPDTVGLYLPSVNAICSRQVDVPVRASSFRNMLTMQGSINWSSSDLRFDSIIGFGSSQMALNNANFGTSQIASGRLSYSWNDAKDIGITLPDTTTLFILRFTVLTNSIKTVPITFTNTPTSTEYTDGRLVKKTVIFNQGSVSVTCEFILSGRVLTPTDKGVRNVMVALTDGSTSQTAITDSLGAYSFKVLPGTYTLTPTKTFEQNKTNGVSTLDLALIQSHILQRNPFDAAYKVIAGDANNSSSVTNADILDIRRLILGTDTTLANNRIWAFVDGDQAFSNINNPFPINSTKVFTNLSSNVNHTFRGIKIGDVNYDRNPLLDQAPSGDTLRLYYEWSEDHNGHILLRLKSKAIAGILGYQTTLKWDAGKLSLDGVLTNPTGIAFGERWKNDGYLTLSWNDPQSRGLSLTEGFLLLELRFRNTPRLDRTELRLDQAKLSTEAFNANLQSVGVMLSSTEIKGSTWQGMLRIFPNPAGREINIEWRNESKGKNIIRLLDASGRVTYMHSGFYESGVQRHVIHRNTTATSAASYIVQVESEGRILKGNVVTVNQAPLP
jgi:hypothetical protein